MRYVFVILMLTSIALGVVHLRRSQCRLNNEIRKLDLTHIRLKREVWSRQVELGHALSPGEIARRLRAMGLVGEDDLPGWPEPVGGAE
jgi:hypothetical protein